MDVAATSTKTWPGRQAGRGQSLWNASASLAAPLRCITTARIVAICLLLLARSECFWKLALVCQDGCAVALPLMLLGIDSSFAGCGRARDQVLTPVCV